MRVDSVRLHPFAGTADREIEFGPELNVILGPNEAGKSSILSAVVCGLFVPAALTTKSFEKEVGRFVPVGGDTARVSLSITARDRTIRLEKRWVRGNRRGSVQLTLPRGEVVSDDERAHSLVLQMLPSTEATFQRVLLAYQARLAPDGGTLTYGAEIGEEIGAILRSAVMNTGGISVDRFRAKVEEEHAGYFGNWDESRDAPLGGRGIDNPYKRGNGKVIDACYRFLVADRDATATEGVEIEIDTLNKELSAVEEELASVRTSLGKLEPLRKSVQERSALASRVEALSERRKALEDISRKWAVAEAETARLAQDMAGLTARRDSLKTALHAAGQYEAGEQLRARIAEIETADRELAAAAAKRDAVPKVEAELLRELRDRTDQLAQLEARASASHLSIGLFSESSETVVLNAEEIKVPPEGVTRRVSGPFRINHAGLSISVGPDIERNRPVDLAGNGGGAGIPAADFLSSLERARSEVSDRLAAMGVASLREAEEVAQSRRLAEQAVEIHAARMRELVGDDSLEALRRRLEASGAEIAPPERSSAEIGQQLGSTEARITETQRRMDETAGQVSAWKEELETPAAVFEKAAEVAGETKEAERKLAALPGMPEEAPGPDEFFALVDGLAGRERTLTEKAASLREERARREAVLPPESSEELRGLANDLRREYERTLSRGKAVRRVLDRAIELMERSGTGIYVPLRDRFLRWFGQITKERYVDTEMETTDPASFVDRDGRRLPYSLLSAGTRDAAALAIRLGMAEYLLDGSDGLLVLDDPLVDMDPERRRRAADALRTFAARRQVIILTCHPEHAQMLGGNVVAIE